MISFRHLGREYPPPDLTPAERADAAVRLVFFAAPPSDRALTGWYGFDPRDTGEEAA